MLTILSAAALRVQEGRYSIRVLDCSHFVFQAYGGDICNPAIDADADTAEDLVKEAQLVSAALATAGIRHRFEVYNSQSELVGYVHFGWPQIANA